MKGQITVERLKSLLRYEPDTGEFVWLVSRGRTAKAGSRAGSLTNSGGYRQIMIDGATYNASNLAWLYMTGEWPDGDVDHRDCNRQNDRWDNFRLASRGQNCANRKKHSNNRSGFKGVSFRKSDGKWVSKICVNYQAYYLGAHDTAEDAHRAYVAAAQCHFGEFARAA